MPVYVQDNKTAADGTDGIVDDVILVTVNITDVNEAPTITGGAINITRPENTSTSTVIDTFEASDEDDPTTSHWTLEALTRATSPSGGTPMVQASSSSVNVPNYEMPADADANNIYEIEVRGLRRFSDRRRETSPSPSRTSTRRPGSRAGLWQRQNQRTGRQRQHSQSTGRPIRIRTPWCGRWAAMTRATSPSSRGAAPPSTMSTISDLRLCPTTRTRLTTTATTSTTWSSR